MRVIAWLIRIVVFVLFLAFAIENTEPVINFVDIEYEEPYDKKIKK